MDTYIHDSLDNNPSSSSSSSSSYLAPASPAADGGHAANLTLGRVKCMTSTWLTCSKLVAKHCSTLASGIDAGAGTTATTASSLARFSVDGNGSSSTSGSAGAGAAVPGGDSSTAPHGPFQHGWYACMCLHVPACLCICVSLSLSLTLSILWSLSSSRVETRIRDEGRGRGGTPRTNTILEAALKRFYNSDFLAEKRVCARSRC